MKNFSKKALALLCIFTFVATIGLTLAYTTWNATGTWTTTNKNFSIWDSAANGNQLSSPYYIQNDGNTPLTVAIAGGAVTGTGNTAAWDHNTYTVPVGTTRTAATLSLTITSDGSYTWSFVAQ
jgi:hypothetical protein